MVKTNHSTLHTV